MDSLDHWHSEGEWIPYIHEMKNSHLRVFLPVWGVSGGEPVGVVHLKTSIKLKQNNIAK